MAKTGWCILFLTGAGFTAWNVFEVFSEFAESPVDTTVTRQVEDTFEFPGVTICNLNKVHCGNLGGHIESLKSTEEEDPSAEVLGRVVSLCSLFLLGRCDTALFVKLTFENGFPLDELHANRSRACDDVDGIVGEEVLDGLSDQEVEAQYSTWFGSLSVSIGE